MAVFPLLAAPLLASPAQAGTSDPAPTPAKLVSVGSVKVETFSANGRTVVATRTYGPETEGLLMSAPTTATGGLTPMSSGDGGSTSASGCIRVTVNNEAETVLGFTAYWFHTWTRWCWTRSTQTVYDVSTGWTISDVDSQEYWRGIVNKELVFYDFSTNDGHPHSAYKHYRQGRFENCVLKYGCIGNTYPANTLRSYYNGTWAWTTSG